uniref:Uncharacterized protein n=1 Tax=Ciona savignyi TaxID=51511 RepID=H2Z9S8_CIOSA
HLHNGDRTPAPIIVESRTPASAPVTLPSFTSKIGQVFPVMNDSLFENTNISASPEPITKDSKNKIDCEH